MAILDQYGIMWYHIAIALGLVLLVLLVSGGVFRIALILVILVAVVSIGVGTYKKYTEVDNRTNAIRVEVIDKLLTGAGAVKYSEQPDGSYTISRHGVVLSGTKDSDTANVVINGQTLDIQLTQDIKFWIKKQASSQ
jgi:uncharacterized membrane protein